MTESGRLICKCRHEETETAELSSTYRVHRRAAPRDVVSCRLLAEAALELPQQDEGEEDEDQQDDGDGDAD